MFGFSRGAAAARNFIYEINSTNKRSKDIAVTKSNKVVGNKKILIKGGYYEIPIYQEILITKDEIEVEADYLEEGKLPRFGYLGYLLLKNGTFTKEDLKNIQINIRFIGVYDTVSSYEEVNDSTLKFLLAVGEHLIKNQFQNDVEQLQLNNLGNFEKAVHFTAMDEHRENFDLTRMYITNSVSMPNSLEFNLPGVHCDIGGAYLSGIEKVKQIETNEYASNKQLKQRIEKLISEYWYKENQLRVNDKLLNFFAGVIIKKELVNLLIPSRITGSRFIHKEYSYIPLHFMETLFREILGEKSNEVFTRSLENKFSLIVNDFLFETKQSDNSKIVARSPLSSTKNQVNVIKTESKILIHAKERLHKYVFEDYPEWKFRSDKEIEKQKKEDDLLVEEYNKINGIKEENTFNFTKFNFNPLEWNIPQDNKEIKTDLEKIEKSNDLEEIVIPAYNEQVLLRILRNRFLHWSATREGFGMDPRDNYKRVEH